MSPETENVRAIDVRPGDYIDLEGDPYANDAGERIEYQYEYAEVFNRDVETPECVALGFAGVMVGFPHHHLLRRLRMAPAPGSREGAAK